MDSLLAGSWEEGIHTGTQVSLPPVQISACLKVVLVFVVLKNPKVHWIGLKTPENQMGTG